MEITIDAAQIDQLAHDALLKSAFGKTIQDAISKTLSSTYNNPIDEALKKYMSGLAVDIIESQYKEQIATGIATVVAQRLTKDFIEKFTGAVFDKLDRALKDY
jgi:hypothetical protein